MLFPTLLPSYPLTIVLYHHEQTGVIVMKPTNLKTRIFLDGGDPEETKKIIGLLGFLDGQTTNPTLIAKNPAARARLERGEKFSAAEVIEFYRQVVSTICGLIPKGSVSVEVYSDATSKAETMLLIPKVKIRPPANVGVDLGPGPCFAVAANIWKGAA